MATDQASHSRLLLEEGDIKIERMHGLSQEVIQFLDSVTWGTDYSLYEHLDTEERIRHLADPHLILLRFQGRIGGTAVFTRREVLCNGQSFNSYYIRYFAASEEMRGKGLIKKYGVQIMQLIRQDVTEKTIFWGAIERGNIRSWKVASSAGYVESVSMKTMGFSRFFPKIDPRMTVVAGDAEKKEMLGLLKGMYKHHNLVQFESLFIHGNYFTLREKGEIIAGAQVHLALWSVRHMPGIKGKLILNVIPILPFINKIFNPKRFDFLGFEGIYFKPGRENEVLKLFSSLLAHFNKNSALFWFDPRCPHYATLKKQGHLGMLYPFVKNADSRIMISFENMDKPDQELVNKGPDYLSAFDFL